MNKNQFYAECAALLGVEHLGTPFPHYRRTRWNNRMAGQGRFPDRGIIRVFGTTVHVALNNPTLRGYYHDMDSALVAIKNALENS